MKAPRSLVWLVYAAGFAATVSNADPFVFERSEASQRRVQEESCTIASCPATQVEFKGEPKDAIFNQINAMEMASVVEYLKAEGVVEYNRGELPGANETLNSNYVMNFALQLPPKAEVLAYLDEDGPMPDRYCEVVVNRGAATPRDVMVSKRDVGTCVFLWLCLTCILSLALRCRSSRGWWCDG